MEINGRPSAWLEATASYAIQKSDDNEPDGSLENSPVHLAKLRFAVPWGRMFDVSSGMQYSSSRRTLAGAYTPPVSGRFHNYHQGAAPELRRPARHAQHVQQTILRPHSAQSSGAHHAPAWTLALRGVAPS